ncbi:CLUMA_CG012440, isoform A [Clunio marinus]|uniref:CLUMA_CG012440, isoform A n=1 Tax=Clunio marinus TaxID=568069 RepID=A0A1J1IFM4_9DIPT|nr:CLUMA_CG012440, isoform A [Clunio marinus]
MENTLERIQQSEFHSFLSRKCQVREFHDQIINIRLLCDVVERKKKDGKAYQGIEEEESSCCLLVN